MKKRYRRKTPKAGEAGFTLLELVIVIVVASILGTFVSGALTSSLHAQRNMQMRKEMSDAAIRTLDKIYRDLREAQAGAYVHPPAVPPALPNLGVGFALGATVMYIGKPVTSSANGDLIVMYSRDVGGVLRRASMAAPFNPGAIGTGDVIANDMTLFSAITPGNIIQINLTFGNALGVSGSTWVTQVMPRN